MSSAECRRKSTAPEGRHNLSIAMLQHLRKTTNLSQRLLSRDCCTNVSGCRLQSDHNSQLAKPWPTLRSSPAPRPPARPVEQTRYTAGLPFQWPCEIGCMTPVSAMIVVPNTAAVKIRSLRLRSVLGVLRNRHQGLSLCWHACVRVVLAWAERLPAKKMGRLGLLTHLVIAFGRSQSEYRPS